VGAPGWSSQADRRKTSALLDVLARALLPLTDRLELAFVDGSIASGKAPANAQTARKGRLNFVYSAHGLFLKTTVVRPRLLTSPNKNWR